MLKVKVQKAKEQEKIERINSFFFYIVDFASLWKFFSKI
jgi:hypothetical protein